MQQIILHTNVPFLCLWCSLVLLDLFSPYTFPPHIFLSSLFPSISCSFAQKILKHLESVEETDIVRRQKDILSRLLENSCYTYAPLTSTAIGTAHTSLRATTPDVTSKSSETAVASESNIPTSSANDTFILSEEQAKATSVSMA